MSSMKFGDVYVVGKWNLDFFQKVGFISEDVFGAVASIDPAKKHDYVGKQKNCNDEVFVVRASTKKKTS